jgi:hypothetical protein
MSLPRRWQRNRRPSDTGCPTEAKRESQMCDAGTALTQPERKQSLMELISTIQQLAEMATTAETPEEVAIITAEFERMVSSDVPAKVDGIGFYKQTVESGIQLRKDMISEIQDSIHAEQAKLARLLLWTHRALKASGTPELKGDVFTVDTRAGQPELRITDLRRVPDKYLIWTVEMPAKVWDELSDAARAHINAGCTSKSEKIDSQAIIADLKANRKVSGAELIPAEDILVVRRNARKTRKEEVPQDRAELLTAK